MFSVVHRRERSVLCLASKTRLVRLRFDPRYVDCGKCTTCTNPVIEHLPEGDAHTHYVNTCQPLWAPCNLPIEEFLENPGCWTMGESNKCGLCEFYVMFHHPVEGNESGEVSKTSCQPQEEQEQQAVTPSLPFGFRGNPLSPLLMPESSASNKKFGSMLQKAVNKPPVAAPSRRKRPAAAKSNDAGALLEAVQKMIACKGLPATANETSTASSLTPVAHTSFSELSSAVVQSQVHRPMQITRAPLTKLKRHLIDYMALYLDPYLKFNDRFISLRTTLQRKPQGFYQMLKHRVHPGTSAFVRRPATGH